MNLDETVNVSVRFSWELMGEVILDHKGSLAFPRMQFPWDGGGVYRITGRRPIETTSAYDRRSRWFFYIGQSRDIPARLNKYRNPGPNQATNIRVNEALRAELRQGTRISLSVAREMRIKVGKEWRDLDTGSTIQRTLAESAALMQAYATEDLGDVDILNKGLDDSVDREFKDAPWP
ncbi:GIY-YIG nuclease family protein [Actinomadura montaniterrae]|uniref:Uncharacterized protein n=1 Tax=Actinomadura montaniterrae TaxID=1803903 RepID=A0A6L3VPL5_9ACTN|nr:hypothetical protein [Actinomadura montaniterrae]KAB2371011.1 hypothetical protein F9B16_33385 [Actinomadura montaniterrae]